MEVKVLLKVVLKIVCRFFFILGPWGWRHVNLGVRFGVGDEGVWAGWGGGGGGVGGFFWHGVKILGFEINLLFVLTLGFNPNKC